MNYNKYRTGFFKKNFILMNKEILHSFSYAAISGLKKDGMAVIPQSGIITREIKLDVVQMDAYARSTPSTINHAIIRNKRPFKH